MYSRVNSSISDFLMTSSRLLDNTMDGKNWNTRDVLGGKQLQQNPWGAVSESHLPGGPIKNFVLETGGTEWALTRYKFPRDRFLPSKVIAFPEVIEGNKFGTNISQNTEDGISGLPILEGDIRHIYVDFEWRELNEYQDFNENPGVTNVAIETFLMSGEPDPIVGPGHPNHDRMNSQVELELMIWLKEPRHEDPDIGIVPGQIVGKVDVYDHLTGKNRPFTVYRNGPAYVAFIADEPWLEGRICWSDLLEACKTRANEWDIVDIDPDWRLGAIEFGTEIWTGFGAWIAKKFDVEVEVKTAEMDPQISGNLYSRLAQCHLELAETYQEIAEKR